ncbi:MAG TPA: chemotaxis-specific protein-glutamate methyltransferase CheB [Myxococcales bacterium]|jgi:two-component system chemotaxis response regulator CheB
MIRCLIVDDSPTFRAVMRRVLLKSGVVEIVGEAADGEEAVSRAVALRPDVITMDVRMPRRDGLQAIAEIMRVQPSRIVVVSAVAGDGNEELTFQALKLGAVEVLGKPTALSAPAFEQQANAIRQKVLEVARIASPASLPRAPAVSAPVAVPAAPVPAPRGPRPVVAHGKSLCCIGIVASTGGPPALNKVLSALPASFPVPILVVQHIAAGFGEGMVRWLAAQCAVKVKVAKAGDALEPGTVLFAPDDAHLMVSMGRVRLDSGPPVKNLRPSGTVLLTSLAREFGASAAGLVLTGMGDDGSAGLKLMREQGAFTAAQGRSTSVVYGMPEVATRTGAAQVALELDEIAPALLRLAERSAPGLKAAPAPSASPAAQPSAGGRRRKLLLADDAETILALEQALLSDIYELVLARDGEQALEAALTHRPDGVLLDHSMPKMTGAQVLERIRAAPSIQPTPVIMVSSETSPEIVGSWQKHGATAILGKPIDRALLLATVRRLVPER